MDEYIKRKLFGKLLNNNPKISLLHYHFEKSKHDYKVTMEELFKLKIKSINFKCAYSHGDGEYYSVVRIHVMGEQHQPVNSYTLEFRFIEPLKIWGSDMKQYREHIKEII